MGEVLVLGLISGGIYGLLAVGIVLVYRGSGALNFAQGEIGTLGLYIAAFLVTENDMPWMVGALAALVVAAAVGAGFERLVVRRMVDASRLSVAVATVGLLSFLIAVEFKVFTGSPRTLRGPIDGVGIQIFGVFVSPTQLLSLLVTAAVGVGLAALLKRTDFGLGVLGAAQDPAAVRLVGVPLNRVSAFVWGAGAAISALAALLIEPTVGVFAPGFATDLFLRGLAAAIIGGLLSLPGAFVGGIVLGLLEALGGDLLADTGLPGAKTLTVFVVLLVVLLARPQGLLQGIKRSAVTA